MDLFKNAKKPTLSMLKESLQCGVMGACFGVLGMLIMASGMIGYFRKQSLGQKRVAAGAKMVKSNIIPMVEMLVLGILFGLIHHFAIHPNLVENWKYILAMLGCVLSCIAIMTMVCLTLKSLGLRDERCPQCITDEHRNKIGILQFPSFVATYIDINEDDSQNYNVNESLAAGNLFQECVDMFFKPFFIIIYAIMLVTKLFTKALSYIIDGIAFIIIKIKTAIIATINKLQARFSRDDKEEAPREIEMRNIPIVDVPETTDSRTCKGDDELYYDADDHTTRSVYETMSESECNVAYSCCSNNEIKAIFISITHFILAFFPVPFKDDKPSSTVQDTNLTVPGEPKRSCCA